MTKRVSRSGRTIPPLMTAIVIIAGSVFGLLWSWQRLTNAASSAATAQTDVRDVARLSRDIRAATQRPRIASLEMEPPDRISRRIQTALEASGLSAGSLISVDPQTPTRVSRTAYLIRSTLIVLEDVSLPGIMRFGESLEDLENGMTIRDCSVSTRASSFSRRPSATGPQGERWDARLTLTQMIYSPISER